MGFLFENLNKSSIKRIKSQEKKKESINLLFISLFNFIEELPAKRDLKDILKYAIRKIIGGIDIENEIIYLMSLKNTLNKIVSQKSDYYYLNFVEFLKTIYQLSVDMNMSTGNNKISSLINQEIIELFDINEEIEENNEEDPEEEDDLDIETESWDLNGNQGTGDV